MDGFNPLSLRFINVFFNTSVITWVGHFGSMIFRPMQVPQLQVHLIKFANHAS